MSQTLQNHKKGMGGICLSSLLIVFTFLFFGSLEIYISNSSKLWFGLNDVLYASLLIGLIALLSLCLIGFVLPAKLKRLYNSLLLGLGIALYVQGTFLQLNYGILDGKDVDWSQYSAYAVFNTILWLLMVFIPVVVVIIKPKIFKKINTFLTLCIISVQCVTILILAITVPIDKQSTDVFYLSKNNMFEHSDNSNIVIFVLDMFDTAHMNRILNEYPEYLDIYEDFTYYNNTVGLFPTTYPSIPYLLTGNKYLNEEPFYDYISTTYDSSIVFEALENNNYQINIYTDDNLVDLQQNRVNNTANGSYRTTNSFAFSKSMYKLVGIRYFPHMLKKYVWMYGGEFDQYKAIDGEVDKSYVLDDLLFYNDLLEQKISVSSGVNYFKFYHLFGAHPPYIYDEKIQPIDDGYAIHSEVNQWRGSLNIIAEYIEQLKEQEIYENTTIIILADHGHQAINLAACPLLMIKNSGHGFTVSEAPVSYNDIIPVLLGYIEGDEEKINSINVNDNTERVYYYYDWHYGMGAYLPGLRQYTVTGESWDISGYQAPDYEFTAEGLVKIDRNYVLGNKINFDLSHQNNKYILYGMSNPDLNHSWAVGSETKLQFDLNAAPDHDLVMEMDYVVYRNAEGYQRVLMYANGTLISQDQLDGSEETISYIIPQELAQDGSLEIVFTYPDAYSPSDLSLSVDIRTFSIGIKSITIR